MSAPQKPWENMQKAPNQNISSEVIGPGRNVLHSHAPQPSGYGPSMTVPVSRRASNLPPLPPRPQQLFNRPAIGMAAPTFGGYSGYTSGYGTYGGYGASSYGGYGASSYGGMYGGMGGYGYGSYPVGAGFENRFLQVAEEGSRDAFQSIESIVRAFASVSMMLESTYYAMYSSFRAVLGVVDNFSRLRQMFVQFLSTITILRIIRNFYHRLIHWLGLIDRSPQAEQVWESVNTQAGGETQHVEGGSKWPLIAFVAFLFGGPYLMSKLFSSSIRSRKQWDCSEGKNVRAAYPHQAGTQAELGFQANEVLNLAPKELQPCGNSGWLLACNQRGQVGFIPLTRLAVTAPNPTATETTNAPSQESSDIGDSQSNEAPCAESQ